MREQEFESLKSDLKQYVKFFSEHTYKLFERIIFLWGGTLAFFSTTNLMENPFLFFIVATILFISVIVLYIFAHKKLEGIQVISRIGSYITVFYEKRPNDPKDEKIFWELTNYERDKKDKEYKEKPDRKHEHTSDKVFKGECFVFSLIATALEIILFIIFCIKNFECLKNMNIRGDTFMLGICVVYVVFSAILSSKIYTISFKQSNWLEIKRRHLRFYMDYAEETGYYTKEEAIESFGEEFYNEIHENKQG